MLSGVGCVAKGSGDVGVFGVPEDAGRGWFHEGEEKQERKVWPPNAFFVGAPLAPGLLIVSPEPALILLRLA